MKILTLDLKAFGPFSGVRLDLSGGEHGLHVILGANEAGKTSAMRALSCLLFGFPARTTDDFLHGHYDRLRVGGTLRHSDGETLTVLRRKGNKNTLREADDVAVVPDDRLARLLGAIEAGTFRSLFGLDHEKLAEAADEIRDRKGLLGETLFAAGTGLAGLKKAQQGIRGRMDLLFKPMAKNPAINRALSELREAKETLKKAQLPGEDWVEQDRALSQSRARAAELAETLDRLRRERDRIGRTRAAVPQAARRRQVLGQIAALGDVARLREGFGAECLKAAQDARVAEAAIQRARSQLAGLADDLAALPTPGPILDAEADVEAIDRRHGAIEKAVLDRGRRAQGVAEHEYKAKEILRKIGRAPDLDVAEELRSIRDDELAAIRALGQDASGLRAERDAAALAIAERESTATRLGDDREKLGVPDDAGPLRRAALRARAAGDLEDRLMKATATRKKKARDVEKAVGRLSGWSGDPDALERMAVPLGATLDQFEAAFHEDDEEARRADEKIAEELRAIDDLTARLSALERSLDVPTEADLREARSRRDEGWRRLRDSGATPDRESVGAYELSVRVADDLSDRLRREAERVAHKCDWLARSETHRSALARWQATREEMARRADVRREAWRSVLSPMGLAGRTPAEVRAWLAVRTEALQAVEQAGEAARECEDLERALDEHFAGLASAFDAIGVPAPARRDGFRAWVELAEGVLRTSDREAQDRENLDARLAEIRAEGDRDRHRLARADDRLAEWQRAWAAKMGRLGYEPDMTTAQADAILADIQDLGETMIKLHGQRSQVRTIDRDVEAFASDAAGLVQRAAPDLAGQPFAGQVREMSRRLKESRALAQKRSALAEQRDGEAARLRVAEADHAAAVAALERLRREAGCASADDLAEADRRSRELGRLLADRRSCEDGLSALAVGQDLDAFVTSVEEAREEELGPRTREIEAEIEALDAEMGDVRAAGGVAQERLRKMDGGAHSAEAAEASQEVLARLQADVTRFATLKLADSVLRRGIDRYREKNQGPILSRAGELFSGLTGGSFARLQIDDDEGRAVLQGVRGDGTAVGVDGMSDGSHDQLYLALRLASLESWLRTHEAIPLVVDDILLNFDDRRAMAALRALADLSSRTQVLFFTHHRHLADLASAHLPGGLLFRHELADPVGAA